VSGIAGPTMDCDKVITYEIEKLVGWPKVVERGPRLSKSFIFVQATLAYTSSDGR
jgi:hypothetical protein